MINIEGLMSQDTTIKDYLESFETMLNPASP